jgi:dihydrofolate reductase
MTQTTCHMSISLDGFVAGPDQDRANPVGVGGLKIHQWHFHAGEPGHEQDAGPRDELMKRRGAYVMGRNMFGPIRREWDEDWRGWWGDEPPYHAPVFVLTHHPHGPIEMEGGTTFHFVTEGFDAALDRAKAAGDGDVDIAGGASTVRAGVRSRGDRRALSRRRSGSAGVRRAPVRRRGRPGPRADRGDPLTPGNAHSLPRRTVSRPRPSTWVAIRPSTVIQRRIREHDRSLDLSLRDRPVAPQQRAPQLG